MYFGDYPVNAVIDIKWTSQGQAGQSLDPSTAGAMRIYKNNSANERTSGAGITDTRDFDAVTGVHHLRIDTTDNTDAGFWAAGGEYQILIFGAVIDTETVNATLGSFSIERVGAPLALLKSGTVGLGALPAATATSILTTVMTEGYAADGAQMTLAQAAYMIWSFLSEMSIAGTVQTSKKLDGTTTSMTHTLNSATTPTATTRAT